MMGPLVVLAHAPPGGHKPFWHARSTWTWPRVLAGHRMDRLPLVACFAAHRGKACIRPCWDFCGRGSDLFRRSRRLKRHAWNGSPSRPGLPWHSPVARRSGPRHRGSRDVTAPPPTIRPWTATSASPPARPRRTRQCPRRPARHLEPAMRIEVAVRGRCPRSALASPAGAGPPQKARHHRPDRRLCRR